MIVHGTIRHQDGISVSHGRYMASAQLKASVLEFIDRYFTDADLDIGKVAQAMCCSTRNIHRVFKNDEMSVSRYLWSARLDYSKKLLESPEWGCASIADVAYASGFTSAAHFSRVFKSFFGCSPSVYRRQKLLVS